MSLLLLLAAPALALPEVMVVGLHLPDQSTTDAVESAARLVEALDNTGKVEAIAPAAVSQRIAGREALILDTYALGAGRDRLNKGKVLYEGAQPEQAIPELEEAARLLAQGLAVSTDGRDLHESLMLLGLSYVGLGNEDAARSAFRRSAVLDPARQLDTVRYSPDVIALFNQVRDEAVALAPAELSIFASAASNVWIDGREIGPVPQASVKVAPGEHHVLVRASNGRSEFQVFVLAAGATQKMDVALNARPIGLPAVEAPARSRQTRDLYRSVGTYASGWVVLLGGMTPTNQVAIQLYSPASGSFSRALTADAGDDPIAAMTDLAPALVAYLGENGDIRADRASSQVIPLDTGANDVLAGLLFDPRDPETQVVEVRRGPKWYVWAGAGLLVAGGGATAAILALGATEETPPVDQGTIEFGPIPE